MTSCEEERPPKVPWTEGELAAELLRASINAAIDVLGSTETTQVCHSYLRPQKADATVRRVTVTGACVATLMPHGDVFVPAAVIPETINAVVGTRLVLSMTQTSTGRSSFLAISAEEAEEDEWQTATRNKKNRQPNHCNTRRGTSSNWKSEKSERPQHRR